MMRTHERWWQDHADIHAGEFGEWLENSDAWSREEVVRVVDAVRGGAEVSVCEIGPGLFHDYLTHWWKHDAVSYRAVEMTPKLAQYGREIGADVVEGSITDLPLDGQSVDVAYCRHVIEHLAPADIAPAMSELVRVSRKAAVVVLFNSTDARHHQYIQDWTVAVGTFCHRISRPMLEKAAMREGMRATWTTSGRDWVLTLRHA